MEGGYRWIGSRQPHPFAQRRAATLCHAATLHFVPQAWDLRHPVLLTKWAPWIAATAAEMESLSMTLPARMSAMGIARLRAAHVIMYRPW